MPGLLLSSSIGDQRCNEILKRLLLPSLLLRLSGSPSATSLGSLQFSPALPDLMFSSECRLGDYGVTYHFGTCSPRNENNTRVVPFTSLGDYIFFIARISRTERARYPIFRDPVYCGEHKKFLITDYEQLSITHYAMNKPSRRPRDIDSLILIT